MILYHAISSYQILCTITHKLLFYPHCKAILILPDFITEKYPQYMKLVELGIFDEVYLFPYLQIGHDKAHVSKRTSYYYSLLIPHDLNEFEDIFIAGAHFYFSLCLIDSKVRFHFFEDAPGMIHKSNILYNNLKKAYPTNAFIAHENKMFDGNNPLVIDIYCRSAGNCNKTYKEFLLTKWLKTLRRTNQKKILSFFGLDYIKTKKNSIVLLTQQFSNLGIMTYMQQKDLIEILVAKLLHYGNVIIKRHPDDKVQYDFPSDTLIISIPFPAELLPLVFKPAPQSIVTISSTAIEELKGAFKNTFSFADVYSDIYSYDDEYTSMMNIIK